MIKANELRIGNWVKPNHEHINQFHGFGRVTTIYTHDEKAIYYNDERPCTVDYHYPGKWFEPIPLTAEILEKAGFVNKAVHEYWMSKRAKNLWASVAYDITGHVLLKDTNDEGLVRITNINYLHQLQNLYFALTGEELEINL